MHRRSVVRELQREPYRLFFPLGMLFAILGVGHWWLHGLGLLADYRPVFHAMTQVQGFLLTFAFGFLLTMLPRRTESEAPATLVVFLCALAPIGTVAAASQGAWAISQVFFLVGMGTLTVFVVRRLTRSRTLRRPPVGFVWIVVALFFGVTGSVLTGIAGFLGMSDHLFLHDLGRGMVLQGMFTALILGVGGLAIPLMTGGTPPADDAHTKTDRRNRAWHLFGAALLLGSFVFEPEIGLSAAYLVRAAVTMTVLIWSADLLRPPGKPGFNRWAIWFAAWAVPIGYAAAALFVEHHKAALHVLFIGGFAFLTLSVSTQLVLGHGGFTRLKSGRSIAVVIIGAALLIAIVPRWLMSWDPSHFFTWMVAAASAFLVAAGTWIGFIVPKLLARRTANAES